MLAKSSCNWVETTVWVPCSENLHDGSNFQDCRFVTHPGEGTPPRAYIVEQFECLLESDPGPGSGGGGSIGGGGFGGGGSQQNPPKGAPTYPCDGSGVSTEQQQPILTDGNGTCSGTPTIPILPNPKDPCEKAKASVNNANSILHEPNIYTEVSTLEGHATNSFTEYGMAIINTGTSTIAQDPYSNNDPNNPGTVTINVPSVGNYLASAHTHPDHGAPPPSVADFYSTLAYSRDYPTFQTSLIFVYNGTKYALVVNDRAKAIAFLAAYPSSSTTITINGKKVFNENSQVGIDFTDIYKSYMSGRFSDYSGDSQDDGLESAFAYILEKYDVGISLAKSDSQGNLKSLRSVSFEHTITSSGGKKVTAYKAQPCP